MYQGSHAFEDIEYARIIKLVVRQIQYPNARTVHQMLDVSSRLQTIVGDL